MTKPLFSPVAGLIQDILLLSTVVLFLTGLCMMVSLKIWDHLVAQKRRKAMMGRVGMPVIQ